MKKVEIVVLMKDNKPKGFMSEVMYQNLKVRKWWDYNIPLTINSQEWDNLHIGNIVPLMRRYGHDVMDSYHGSSVRIG